MSKKIVSLQESVLAGSPRARAELARMRRGVGKSLRDTSGMWDAVFDVVPDEWEGQKSVLAEEAAHAVFSLYALHQQSQSWRAHVRGISFGRAVGRLARRTDASFDAVTRRFMAVITAETTDELLMHVRGLITQLRRYEIGLDYGQFTDGLHAMLSFGRESSVGVRWGRDFYRTRGVPDGDTAAADDTINDDIADDDVADQHVMDDE